MFNLNTLHIFISFSVYAYIIFLLVVLLTIIVRYKIYESKSGLIVSAIIDFIIYFVTYNVTLTMLNKICWCTWGFNNLVIDKVISMPYWDLLFTWFIFFVFLFLRKIFFYKNTQLVRFIFVEIIIISIWYHIALFLVNNI